MIISIIEQVYSLLWGDLITIPLPGGGSLGISLLVLLLIPTGIYFTIRTKFLPLRLFPDMIKSLLAKKEHKDSLSTFQTLIVSTATRVGMGNLVGVVAAISAGGAGAVFWMWVTALLGASTATHRIVHRFYRGDACAAAQREGSALRRVSRRPGILYPSLFRGKIT